MAKPDFEQPPQIKQPQQEIKYFSIKRTLEDIPTPEPCPLCGEPTEKSNIPYLCFTSTTILENSKTPGYKCTKCGAPALDRYTTLELITTAAGLLTGTPEELTRKASLYQDAAAICKELVTNPDSL